MITFSIRIAGHERLRCQADDASAAARVSRAIRDNLPVLERDGRVAVIASTGDNVERIVYATPR